MLLGGFLPLSLCDYPGKLAAVVFTQGCNYRCPFCHNGGLIARQPAISLPIAEVLADLKERRNFLDGVVVSGGEPTLHADLKVFLSALKDMGFTIKLDTNGSRPRVLRELLDLQLLDYIAMDVKASLLRYAVLAGVFADIGAIQESIALIAESGVQHQFRTTFVPPLQSPEDLTSIRAMLPAGSTHLIQDFQPEHALDKTLLTVARQILRKTEKSY
ncbi:MAG TPA: anaerobic ribonucleoside-triphosphate reductase activating protein [Acidobacteriaceae bacterium]